MNVLLAFAWPISESLVERLGWVLVHSLWQFALAALLASVAVRALRRRSAATRYGVLVVALAMALEVDPEYRMAQLLHRALIGGLSPADWALAQDRQAAQGVRPVDA